MFTVRDGYTMYYREELNANVSEYSSRYSNYYTYHTSFLMHKSLAGAYRRVMHESQRFDTPSKRLVDGVTYNTVLLDTLEAITVRFYKDSSDV